MWAVIIISLIVTCSVVYCNSYSHVECLHNYNMCQSESRTGLTVHNQPPCLSDDFIISSTLKYKMTDVYLYVASSMQRVMVCVFVLRINGLRTYYIQQ